MKNCYYFASALTEDSEIRRCLSQISDIPVDRMNYAKVSAASTREINSVFNLYSSPDQQQLPLHQHIGS